MSIFNPPVCDYKPLVVDCQPLVSDYVPLMNDYEPLAMGHNPLASDCEALGNNNKPLAGNAEALAGDYKCTRSGCVGTVCERLCRYAGWAGPTIWRGECFLPSWIPKMFYLKPKINRTQRISPHRLFSSPRRMATHGECRASE